MNTPDTFFETAEKGTKGMFSGIVQKLKEKARAVEHFPSLPIFLQMQTRDSVLQGLWMVDNERMTNGVVKQDSIRANA